MREREFKFLIRPGKALPVPAEFVRGLGRVSVDERDQDAVYFDTPDLRLTRAGASLRYRSDDGWTVKLPESLGAMTVRDELRFPGGDAEEPPDDAVASVRALARSAPLEPVARISTHRRRFQLEDRKGRPIGELDDDTVRGSARQTKQTHFRELEFEVADGANTKAVAKVLKRLHRAGATPDGNRSKVSRVLGDAAKATPDLPPAAALKHGATVEELTRIALTTGTRRLVKADPVVRVGEDPEGVHQARVATRRLRSDLRTLRPFLDRSWSEPLRDELQWIGRLLGQVRDADVLGRLLTEHARTLRPGQHARATSLIRQIEDQRADDRASLLEAMNSTRYLHLLERLVGSAQAPRMRTANDHSPVTVDAAAAHLIRKAWKRLRAEIKRLPEDPPDHELHEVRKRAKQVRYALEAVAPVVGKSASRAATRLASLQDTLGDHQDAVVAAEWIEHAAFQSDDIDTAFVAGELAEKFAADRRQLRHEWPDRWKGARRAYRSRTW